MSVTPEAKLALLLGLSTFIIARMRGMRRFEIAVSILAGWFTRDAYSPILAWIGDPADPVRIGLLTTVSGTDVYLSALFGVGAYTVGRMKGLKRFELFVTIAFGWYAYGAVGGLGGLLGRLPLWGWLTS